MIAQWNEPPLEVERKKNERAASEGRIAVSSEVVCAMPLGVEAVSDTHFRLRFTGQDRGYKDFFLFKVQGVAGKTVRFDLEETDSTQKDHKWVSLNPVYSYAKDLDDPSAYVSDPPPAPPRSTFGWNGVRVPDTRGQQWHFVTDAWEEGGAFCWVQRFDQDFAYVAMRPPYTPMLGERLLEQAAASPYVKLWNIGKSKEGRPLQVVQMGDGTPGSEKTKPCICMYAREHTPQPDASWAIDGAMRWLLSADPSASEARQRFTFLLVPLLDPDGAARGQFYGITYSFIEGGKSPESLAYANWIETWVAQGNRLDLTFNLHNAESAEGPHLFADMFEPEKSRLATCQAFHAAVVRHFALTPYVVLPDRPLPPNAMLSTLGGYLANYYGPLHMIYEFNVQAANGHLSIAQNREMGKELVRAGMSYLSSADGRTFLASVDALRAQRLQRKAELGDGGQATPFAREYWIKNGVKYGQRPPGTVPPPRPASAPAVPPGGAR